MNYEDNATRKTGAISYLLFTSFGMSSNNTVQRSKFINAKPVYFPPIDNRWSNDDYGNTVYKTSVFNDKDGTITGVSNSYIVNERRNRHRRSLRGQAHLERCGVQGRYRAHECWRRWWCCWVRRLRRWRRPSWLPVVPVPVPHEPQLPALAPQVPVQLPPALRVLVLAQAPPGPLLHLLSSPLPQVVVESEVPVRLQGRQSFSAAMARSSPPTGKPTYERAPSTR